MGGHGRRRHRRALPGLLPGRDPRPSPAPRYARELGLRDRPMHPLLLLNFGLSFSVHDVSEQAIAHLAYIDVRFPDAVLRGRHGHRDEHRPRGEAGELGRRGRRARADDPRRTRTTASSAPSSARRSCARGSSSSRPDARRIATSPPNEAHDEHSLPPEMREGVRARRRGRRGFAGFADDFAVGDVIAHDDREDGRARRSTCSSRSSFATRTRSTSTRSTARRGELRRDARRLRRARLRVGRVAREPRHVRQRRLGPRLRQRRAPERRRRRRHALRGVEGARREPHDTRTAVRHLPPRRGEEHAPGGAPRAGGGSFTSELGKKESKVKEKVFEIDRTVLMRKRP